ncbi:hypothetical protein HAX54_011082, partial [Datura stramonium]|nr:hypothetical protein [Datura stramonium]
LLYDISPNTTTENNYELEERGEYDQGTVSDSNEAVVSTFDAVTDVQDHSDQ